VRYLYLHGLASGPSSAKARYFQRLLLDQGETLECPDLNWPDFQSMTITSQLTRINQILGANPEPITVLGSSLGGLMALLLAQRDPRVARLCLMAPALGFLQAWPQRLKPELLTQWQRSGVLSIYHYGYQKDMELGYAILEDCTHYDETKPNVPVPTLIFHGLLDEVVPYQVSVAYAETRPWVKVQLLSTDHAMTDVLPIMGQGFMENRTGAS